MAVLQTLLRWVRAPTDVRQIPPPPARVPMGGRRIPLRWARALMAVPRIRQARVLMAVRPAAHLWAPVDPAPKADLADPAPRVVLEHRVPRAAALAHPGPAWAPGLPAEDLAAPKRLN
jgi:hypothetical protein